MIRRAAIVCVCVAGCAPKALPVVTPVAPCASALAADSTWRLVDVQVDSLVMQLPSAYQLMDGAWVRPGYLVAVRAVRDTLARLDAEAGALKCEMMIAGRQARIVTSASYGEFGANFMVRARWSEAPGQWTEFQAFGQTPAGQLEALRILRSVRHR